MYTMASRAREDASKGFLQSFETSGPPQAPLLKDVCNLQTIKSSADQPVTNDIQLYTFLLSQAHTRRHSPPYLQ